MAHADIEIELKYPLKDAGDVISFLEKNGEPVVKDVFQRDTYYVPAHRNFIE